MNVKLTLVLGLLFIPSIQIMLSRHVPVNCGPMESYSTFKEHNINKFSFNSDGSNSSLSDNKVDYLKDTTYENEEGKIIIKNTEDILILANKKRNLPSDYKPKDLVIPNVKFPFKEEHPKKYLRKEAAEGLEKLFEAAKKDNIILYAISGYRSYDTQKMLFDNKSKQVGPEKANLLVAYPGQSEHQTGLAMDVSSESVNFSLNENFGQVPEGKWLKDNAHKFGFIIRYKKHTTDITGYSYEPWHLRYVGEDIANKVYEEDVTLEEFLGAFDNVQK